MWLENLLSILNSWFLAIIFRCNFESITNQYVLKTVPDFHNKYTLVCVWVIGKSLVIGSLKSEDQRNQYKENTNSALKRLSNVCKLKAVLRFLF